ncbi:MAG: glycosyltransferase family 39 protein, partial [Sphingomonas bacterium]
YAFLAPGFALARPSPFGAAVFSAFVAGLPAALAAWGVRRCGAPRLAVAAALVTLVLPLTIESARNFLLDQPVTLVAGLAAIAWLAAAQRPGWWRFALFAALAAFAALVKGNGLLVALIPPIEIALSRRWALLRDLRLWAAGAAALLVIVPWYLVSFRISAGGFNYAPGLDYAWEALVYNCAAILANIGWVGVLLAVIGAVAGFREAAARLALAVIVATLVCQSAIPVALADRYVLPLLPWCVMLAALGVRFLWERLRILAVALGIGALVVPAMAFANLAPKPDIGAPAIADAMVRSPGIWMVDGRAGGEGAIIAAAAYADAGKRRLWVARASQWLSTSDFMGRDYRLSVHSPEEAAGVLGRLGARGVVVIREKMRPAYPHSVILLRAMTPPRFAVAQRPFPRGAGVTNVARRVAPVEAHPELLSDGAGSRNFQMMGKF